MALSRLFLLLMSLLVVSAGFAAGKGGGGGVSVPPQSGLLCDVVSDSSPDRANINELTDVDAKSFVDYIELKILTDAVDIAGWKLCAAEDGRSPICIELGLGTGYWGDGTQIGLPDNNGNAAGNGGSTFFDEPAWLIYSDEENNGLAPKAGRGEVLLVDSANNVLDHIAYHRTGGGSCVDQNYWAVPSDCSTCLNLSTSSNSKILARQEPDGTGGWGDPGPGATPTTGTSNDQPDPPVVIDHYRIVAPLLGVTCESSSVSITAYDASGNSISPASGTILSISSSHPATLLSPSSVTFDGSQSSVNVSVAQIVAASVNLNLSDSDGASENPSFDPSIVFEDAILKFYDALNATDLLPTLVSNRRSDDVADPQQLELRAIVTDPDTGACVARVSSAPLAVDMGFQCVNPSSCVGGQELRIQGDAGEVALPAAVTLSFDAQGRALIPTLYTDAGQIRLTATAALVVDPTASPPLPAVMLQGTSSDFIVKPAGVCVEALEVDSDCVSGDGSCSRFKQAGEAFQLRVKAVGWQSAGESHNDFCDNPVTPNYQAVSVGLSPQLAISEVGPSWSNGVLGTSSVDISTAGQVTLLSQTISEVGVFQVQAAPPSYFGESLSASLSAPVGRFYPAFFTAVGGGLTHRTDLASCLSDFTYLGEPMRLDFDLLPWRLGADPSTDSPLNNYQGGFVKIGSFSQLNLGAVDGSATALGSRLQAESGLTFTPISGSLGVQASLRIDRLTSPDGPFDDLRLGTAVLDSDSVGVRAADLDLDSDLDSVNDRVELSTAGKLRFGRLSVANVFGPETETLLQPVQVGYFQTGSFVINSNDSCTDLSGLYQFSDAQGTLYADGNTTPSSPVIVSAGELDVSYSAPGAGNQGSVTLRVDLSASPWLRADWDNNGSYDDWDSLIEDAPEGSVTFGRYRGNDRVIFWQENSLR